MNAETTWVHVCALEDIPLLGARVLQAGPHGDIALFRPAAERVFALADRCPHQGGPLSQGLVSGDTVTCPLHGWTIALDSGCACAPDVGCARRYPVRLRAGEVWLSLQPAVRAAVSAEPGRCPPLVRPAVPEAGA